MNAAQDELPDMDTAANPELAGVLRRVRKLMAMAGDGRGDANEAAAAAAMAEKLMRKYQLDHAAVIAAELRAQPDAIIMRPVFGNMKRDDPKRPPLRSTPRWAAWFSSCLAKLHDCKSVYGYAEDKHGTFGACLEIYGYKPDVEVVVWTYDYLVGTMITAMRKFQRESVFKPTKVESNAFRDGFVRAICAKLNDLDHAKRRELTSDPSRALVVAKDRAIADKFGEFGKAKESKPKDRSGEHAFYAGVREGAKVDVTRAALPTEQKPDQLRLPGG